MMWVATIVPTNFSVLIAWRQHAQCKHSFPQAMRVSSRLTGAAQIIWPEFQVLPFNTKILRATLGTIGWVKSLPQKDTTYSTDNLGIPITSAAWQKMPLGISEHIRQMPIHLQQLIHPAVRKHF